MEIHRLNTEGTLDELRDHLSAFMEANPGNFQARTLPPPPRNRRASDASVANLSMNSFANPIASPSPEDRPAKIINQMRKWGFQFEGKDPDVLRTCGKVQGRLRVHRRTIF